MHPHLHGSHARSPHPCCLVSSPCSLKVLASAQTRYDVDDDDDDLQSSPLAHRCLIPAFASTFNGRTSPQSSSVRKYAAPRRSKRTASSFARRHNWYLLVVPALHMRMRAMTSSPTYSLAWSSERSVWLTTHRLTFFSRCFRTVIQPRVMSLGDRPSLVVLAHLPLIALYFPTYQSY